MRVLLVCRAFHPRIGGVETVMSLLARALLSKGHGVTLATDTPAGSEMRGLPFAVHRLPGASKLRRLARAADITLLANLEPKKLPPLLLSGTPLVVQHHHLYRAPSIHGPIKGGAIALIARQLPGIAVSRYLQADTLSEWVVHNPYDAELFTDRIPWPERSRDVVFAGRLVKAKGADVLLRALARLAELGQRPSLTIVGSGPEEAALMALAARHKLGDTVVFAGSQPPAALAEIYTAHKVSVVPSTEPEGFGLAAIESLACGCVPVISDIGGLPEAVGPYGVRAPPGDPDALAAILGSVLSSADPPERTLSLSHHLEALAPGRVAQRYLSIFEACIQRRQRGRSASSA